MLEKYDENVRSGLDDIRKSAPKPAARIRNFRWIKDGIHSRAEYYAAMGIIQLAAEGHAESIVRLPWVVQGLNLPTLEALWALASGKPDTFAKIMSHPTIKDGISDQEAKIVGTLHGVSDPAVVDALLDPKRVTVEERTIELPLAGEVNLALVRVSTGAPQTMDVLELSVRRMEEFMGLPFPRRQVTVLFDDTPGPAGVNYSTHIKLLEIEFGQSADFVLSLLAHEVGHYYWAGAEQWLHEGAAHVMVAVTKDDFQAPLISAPCSLTQTIVAIEALPEDTGSFDYIDCLYSLGERLFRDLYRSMDELAFREAFRRLYLHIQTGLSVECGDGRTSTCHVREAFRFHATEELKDTIGKVIDRWHDASEPYDTSVIMEPVEPAIASISGKVESSYLSNLSGRTRLSDTVVANITNVVPSVCLNLEYSYEGTGGSLPVDVTLAYQDGLAIQRKSIVLQVDAGDSSLSQRTCLQRSEVLGGYWVYAHVGDQKIAQAMYEIVEPPPVYNIRGLFLDSEGQRAQKASLAASEAGKENSWIATTWPDGTYEIPVFAGTYRMEVWVVVGNQYTFVGWIDSEQDITTDPDQALMVTVKDSDVEGIDYVRPENIDGLLCSSGEDRSRETGACP